ncbi:vitamin B12-dependent ribonucleotide reductase [Ruminococcaceae bacterium AM28-23LB]|nr:vitamin B12-dependent ribonucleotide reductase [Ruminococcaceae bacterium AM28-23LB]
MNITENARTVLEKRYLIRDAQGKALETVPQLFQRVASAIAQADRNYDPQADVEKTAQEFYDTMTDLRFLPNSPTLMNAGRELGQLSACFVLPVGDSMEEIFEAVKQAALIHKSGGGTGFSFSRLRPRGSVVNSTGGVASGPISFMKVFNTATEAVKQGGTRRGANMGILQVDHPDILDFISCKSDNNEINNFNISVAITEGFMQAVLAGEDYPLIDPRTKQEVGRLNAREVYDKIVDAAWRNGEPGIVFIDRLNRDNVVPSQGRIESTNPCGEQPLLPYESCNLGSINLAQMVKGEKKKEIDWDKLGRTVDTAVHFLDNVIDVNKYPIPEIDRVTKLTRKVGLGVMAFADLLMLLGVPYNSQEGVEIGQQIMGFIQRRAKEQSRRLAETRGAFPLFGESIYKDETPIRNATVTTIAPTGTLSIIAGVSGGVEPVFAFAFIRNVMDGDELIEVNPLLRRRLEERGLYSDELMKKVIAQGSLQHIEEIPQDIKDVFVCAHDVSPQWHIRMQAAFQKHTDNAVSKTVNFPHSATREDVDKVYRLAYELGCKGVTIYRDGSRGSQVLNIGKVSKEAKSDEAPQAAPSPAQQQNRLEPRPRPAVTMGITEKVKIGCGNLYVTVNYDENGICEVFTNTGRHGGCPSQSEATARLVSIALRSGIDVQTIIGQLKGIRCPSTIRQPGMKVTSCPDAIARAIEKVMRSQNGGQMPSAVQEMERELNQGAQGEEMDHSIAGMRFCPECGAPVVHEGGCVICRQCGYSKCG